MNFSYSILKLSLFGAFLLICANSYGANQIYIDASNASLWGKSYSTSDFTVTRTNRYKVVDIYDVIKVKGGSWEFEFGSVKGELLKTGSYANASKMPGLASKLPYIEASSMVACSSTAGIFIIHEFEQNNDKITKLALDFEVSCDDLSLQTVKGQIRFNSDLPQYLNHPYALTDPKQTVNEGWEVVLDGRQSRAGDSPLQSFAWKQTSGTKVNIENPNSIIATFVAPDVPTGGDTLVFQLQVNAKNNSSDMVSTSINVKDELDPKDMIFYREIMPVYGLGQDTLLDENYGEFKLYGNSSFAWAKYNGYTSNTLIFQAPDNNALEVGEYRGASRNSLEAAPLYPVAEIDDSSCSGDNQTFSSRSFKVFDFKKDENNKPISIAIDFYDFSCIQPAYTAIRINSNYPIFRDRPYANAGVDETIFSGEKTVLNGVTSSSGTDALFYNPDKIVSYSWKQTAGTSVAIDDSSKSVATFTAPAVTKSESLAFELTVTDTQGLQDTDKVIVTVEPTNSVRSFAIAWGDGSYYSQDERGFFATSHQRTFFTSAKNNYVGIGKNEYSESDDQLGIEFQNTPKEGNYKLDGTNGPYLYIKPWLACNSQKIGNLSVTDYVKDEQLLMKFSGNFSYLCSSTNVNTQGKMAHNVSMPGTPPVANAGDDQELYESEDIVFDVSKSVDIDGKIIAYTWRQIKGNLGYIRMNQKITSENKFTIPAPTFNDGSKPAPRVNNGTNEIEMIFELTVADDQGFTSKDIKYVKVKKRSPIPIANIDHFKIKSGSVVKLLVTDNDLAPGKKIANIYPNGIRFGKVITSDAKSITYKAPDFFTGTDIAHYYLGDEAGQLSNVGTIYIEVVAEESGSTSSSSMAVSSSSQSSSSSTVIPSQNTESKKSSGGGIDKFFIVLISIFSICSIFFNGVMPPRFRGGLLKKNNGLFRRVHAKLPNNTPE